ncbi:MAG: cardiolipin synthase [Anaeromyxobacter sp.]
MAAEILWVLGSAAWLAHQRRSPAGTLAWILALAALPLVGIPVYLVLGPRRLERKRLRIRRVQRDRAAYLAACQPQAPGDPQLARLATRLGALPPETAGALSLHFDGDGWLSAVEAAIREARHHVHLEFYIFEAGPTGARVRDALVEAARQGVEVRLLVDDAGSPRHRRRFLRPLLDAGAEVARFNPILFRLRRGAANFRSHRKIVVCDGRVGLTGGINVSDDQSAAIRGAAAWRDTGLRLDGPAVHGLQLAFREDWAFATGRSIPATAAYFPASPEGTRLVQIVPSGPDQSPPAAALLYPAAIAAARERIRITTPYFVPDEPLLTALASAALRGVDVQIILPARTDAWLVDAASRSYRDPLAAAGVGLHLYGPAMVHAKTCVVDRTVALVGSANLDSRSLRLNFEITALLHDPEAVEVLAAQFQRDLAHTCRAPREREAGLGRRLLASIARLLAPQL